MKGGNGFGDLGIATGLSDGAKAGRHMLEGVRYDRRAEESHSLFPQLHNHLFHLFRGCSP